ncbi:MAG TPA: FAD-dependent oxidoreductase, partial [Acidimicrobiia bacterium]
VTIVEGSERVLAAAEPEASRIVHLAMEEEGVGILTGTRVEAVSGDEEGVELTLSDDSAITADRLLVAVGRRGSAGSLGLENAGAVVESGFVQVDGRMRAAEGMWAIGDVTGPPLLTQKALYQGRIAIEDILGADPDPADYTSMPVVTFTDPEVGSVGLTEDQARQQDRPLAVTTKPLESTFRGWLHRIGNTGLIKLVADVGENRLVGATVVGPNAGEILGFLHLAVAQRTPLDALVGLIYAYPTMYGGIGEALGAYGRGVVRVLDPATHPMYDDPVIEV